MPVQNEERGQCIRGVLLLILVFDAFGINTDNVLVRISAGGQISNSQIAYSLQKVIRLSGGGVAETLLVAGPLISSRSESRNRPSVQYSFPKDFDITLKDNGGKCILSPVLEEPTHQNALLLPERNEPWFFWNRGEKNTSSAYVQSAQITLDSNINLHSQLTNSNEFECHTIFGQSKSGESVPIEIVQVTSENEKNQSGVEITYFPSPSFVPVNGSAEQIEKQEVISELQNIAKEFPSCAKYLMQELDKRRSVPSYYSGFANVTGYSQAINGI